MSDLISRSKLQQTIKRSPAIMDKGKHYVRLDAVLGKLLVAPAVDAVPVVHARWKRCFEDWRQQIEGDECSACGFRHYGTAIDHYHYCPNCGAKMNEEEWL